MLFIVGVAPTAAQEIDPSYEVSLQLLTGAGDGAKQALAPELSNVSKQIATRFGQSNLRLTGTFLGRLAPNGDFNYKSLLPLVGEQTAYRSQSFLEWGLRSLRSGQTLKGMAFSFNSFNFGARVPVVTSVMKDPSGKEQPVVNYEQIGVTLNRVSIPENTPTLLSTIDIPGASNTLFLVMTIRPAAN